MLPSLQKSLFDSTLISSSYNHNQELAEEACLAKAVVVEGMSAALVLSLSVGGL
jgi:hypothetical protein